MKKTITLGTMATPRHKEMIEEATARVEQIAGFKPSVSLWILSAIEEKYNRDMAKVVDTDAQ